jgi:protein SCO1/2
MNRQSEERWFSAPGRRIAIAIGARLRMLCLFGVGLAACAPARLAITAGEAYVGTQQEGAAPDFELRDQGGATVRLSQFQGKVVVLTFFDSLCRDVCPLTAAELRTTFAQLDPREAGQVAFLAVNVNAAASGLDDVAEATEQWRLDEIEGFRFLTGTEAELTPVWEAYHVAVHHLPAQADELLHTAGVFLIDQAGEMRWYVSTPYDETGLPVGTAPLSELLVGHIRELLEEG